MKPNTETQKINRREFMQHFVGISFILANGLMTCVAHIDKTTNLYGHKNVWNLLNFAKQFYKLLDLHGTE